MSVPGITESVNVCRTSQDICLGRFFAVVELLKEPEKSAEKMN